MRLTHTPGPWMPSGQLILGPRRLIPSTKPETRPLIVGEVHWDWSGDEGGKESRIPWKEAEANQRLVCAAPELLESLENMIGIIELEGIKGPGVDKAREAIKKAKGEV